MFNSRVFTILSSIVNQTDLFICQVLSVLIVEDNRDVAELIRDSLSDCSDYRFEFWTPNQSFNKHNIDLIILDEDLGGGLSGLAFLKNFKAENMNWDGAVIMITARDDESMIHQAFAMGVDDYIVKPFRPSVLCGKVQALAKRCRPLGGKMDASGIEIDPNLHQIKIDGEAVKFTLTEYRMLVELVKVWGSLVTREHFRSKVFEGAHVTDRTIDVHICSVRKKLGKYGDQLKTIRGVGYRLNGESAD